MVAKRYPNAGDTMIAQEAKSTQTHVRAETDLLRKCDDARAYRVMKRLMDVVLSVFALVVLWPLMLVVALVIYMDDPKGSAVFSQQRVGKNGKLFRFYKFRSMVVDAESRLKELQDFNEMDGPVFKIRNDPRVTRVGHFIRKTSIDELPQLINIIKGDMSIVGPRPALPGEVEKYSDYERQRLLVKPGLTCYWQVSGRNNIAFNEWMAMDMQYVHEHNLRIDIMMIINTIYSVIKGCGAM